MRPVMLHLNDAAFCCFKWISVDHFRTLTRQISVLMLPEILCKGGARRASHDHGTERIYLLHFTVGIQLMRHRHIMSLLQNFWYAFEVGEYGIPVARTTN